VAALRERCRAGRDIVCDALAELPRVRFHRPPGAFYLFFSVDGEPDSRALALRLIDDANVGLAPGSAFGPGGEGYLRLCFGGSHDLLRRAMDRLGPALT
jgi:aspartate/methionine/tyrosine aminotransferase